MRCCVLCGATSDVTKHHVGGQNFIGWFTMPVCTKCQETFHAKQRAADIDLRNTSNSLLRLLRAMKMTVLFLWVLLDMFESEIDLEVARSQKLEASQ